MQSEILAIRVSPIDLAKIDSKVAASNKTFSDFARAALLGKRVAVQKSDVVDFETRNELRRIGVNLNQIAKALNSRKSHIPDELTEACRKLDLVFDKWLNHGSPHFKNRP